MKVYRPLFLSLLLCLSSLMSGQPKYHIEHYSPKDGLPQRIISAILQDQKGFIWLATWDGLCKFDGYNFTTYKTTPGDSIVTNTNRVDNIQEDKYGYIWLYTYNREPFRFDPRKEKYVATFKMNGKPFNTWRIYPMPSGKVWLTSLTMGCICVTDSLNTHHAFSAEAQSLPTDKVNAVFEDSQGFSWILTDSGLVRFPSDLKDLDHYSLFYAEHDRLGNPYSFYSAIEVDHEIWFGCNNGRVLSYNKKSKQFSLFETGVSSNLIVMKSFYDNLLLILTSHDGFLVCDRNRANVKRYNRENFGELPTNEMYDCYIDNSNNVWIQTRAKGVVKFNLLENKLRYYLPDDYGEAGSFFSYYGIIEDKENNIWLHPHGGFSFYDEKKEKLIPFFHEVPASERKSPDILYDSYLDKQGNLWKSTRMGWLDKVVFDNASFRLNDFYDAQSFATGYEVRSLMEDLNGNIWLGNMNSVLSVYTADKVLKGYLCEDGTISKSGKPLKAMAYSLLQASDGCIWIGTKGGGLFRLDPKDDTFNTFRIAHFTHDPTNPTGLSSNVIYALHEDEHKRIWLGTFEGLHLFDAANNQFFNHKNGLSHHPIESNCRVRTVQSLNGKIYVGTTLGLLVFAVDDVGRVTKMKHYSQHTALKNRLKANDIHNIHITKANEVYVSTFGGGVSLIAEWDEEGFPAAFKTYDSSNGLHTDIILSVTEDANRYLWLNSDGSLFRFDPKEETFELFNDVGRTINNRYFLETRPLLTGSGQLIYGCAEGVLSFTPTDILKNDYVPYLALIKFKVSNEDYPLTNHIDDVEEISLTHKENIFSLEYTALDYTDPQGISYAYMLEGFDQDWVLSGRQRMANYTNIPPGEYLFKVKSTNANGAWTDNERHLKITIRPSFWQTGWAYLLYVLTAVALSFLLLRSIFLYLRMRDRIRLEHEQTEMKTTFFTDISHEIRTPLTMIVSPLESILDNEKTAPELKPQLHLILRNTNRLLKMVNQILDFKKIQKQPLRVREITIGPYIENLCETFLKITENRNIRLHINNRLGDETVWVDGEAIEKLLFNLISNAVKHNREREVTIDINLFGRDNAIVLQVKDNGAGMTKETISKLFTRFTSFSTDKSNPGTGIGLSIVKEIVDKHQAKISVDSDENKGACFTISFLPGAAHFLKDNQVEVVAPECEEPTEGQVSAIEKEELKEESRENLMSSILVVEDDPELRGFIKSLLINSYTVYEAKNGKEGYELSVQCLPNFILSDVMMPEMDGMEFLQAVRSNPDISHIPFILLTAKTNMADRLEGIQYGADDYITKPFSVKLLMAKIENILNQRRLFANYLSVANANRPQEEIREYLAKNNITEQDELFIKNLQAKVIERLDDSELTIDELVGSTNLSRSVFFNKLKSLTGLAPVEFVRDIRLKQAAKLLQTGQYRVKEVVYMVGYLDLRYFTNCFKAMYGVTPSQYRNMGRDETDL